MIKRFLYNFLKPGSRFWILLKAYQQQLRLPCRLRSFSKSFDVPGMFRDWRSRWKSFWERMPLRCLTRRQIWLSMRSRCRWGASPWKQRRSEWWNVLWICKVFTGSVFHPIFPEARGHHLLVVCKTENSHPWRDAGSAPIKILCRVNMKIKSGVVGHTFTVKSSLHFTTKKYFS